VLLSDRPQHGVVEDVVLALRERTPGLDLDPVVLQERLRLHLLVERVGLDSVDRGRHVVVHEEVHDAVREEVAHTDRSYSALPVQLLHGSPCAVHVAVRLVDQELAVV
jgi:hypothetical protein